MSKHDIGQEILDGVREIKACKAGKEKLCTRTLKQPAPPIHLKSYTLLTPR